MSNVEERITMQVAILQQKVIKFKDLLGLLMPTVRVTGIVVVDIVLVACVVVSNVQQMVQHGRCLVVMVHPMSTAWIMKQKRWTFRRRISFQGIMHHSQHRTLTKCNWNQRTLPYPLWHFISSPLSLPPLMTLLPHLQLQLFREF
jgi:hypothetical protein